MICWLRVRNCVGYGPNRVAVGYIESGNPPISQGGNGNNRLARRKLHDINGSPMVYSSRSARNTFIFAGHRS